MIELLEKKIRQPYKVSNLGNSTKDIDPADCDRRV
jgi:hypothetical protein